MRDILRVAPALTLVAGEPRPLASGHDHKGVGSTQEQETPPRRRRRACGDRHLQGTTAAIAAPTDPPGASVSATAGPPIEPPGREGQGHPTKPGKWRVVSQEEVTETVFTPEVGVVEMDGVHTVRVFEEEPAAGDDTFTTAAAGCYTSGYASYPNQHYQYVTAYTWEEVSAGCGHWEYVWINIRELQGFYKPTVAKSGASWAEPGGGRVAQSTAYRCGSNRHLYQTSSGHSGPFQRYACP